MSEIGGEKERKRERERRGKEGERGRQREKQRKKIKWQRIERRKVRQNFQEEKKTIYL